MKKFVALLLAFCMILSCTAAFATCCIKTNVSHGSTTTMVHGSTVSVGSSLNMSGSLLASGGFVVSKGSGSSRTVTVTKSVSYGYALK